MQETTLSPSELMTAAADRRASGQVAISLEVVLYALIFALALVFRLANLDNVPLSVYEAPDALAAWRTTWSQVEALPQDIVTDSPILFWAQRIGFTVLGGSEFAARILTALAGVALAFSPLLLRDTLGKTRTFILCALLALSPVALLASRYSEPVIWSLSLAMLAVWMLRRWQDTRSTGDGLIGITLIVSLVLLSEPGGAVLALSLLGALVFAHLLSAGEAMDETGSSSLVADLQTRLQGLPILTGLLTAAGVALAVSTEFMTYPQGFSGISELLDGFLRGWVQRAPDAPLAFPLVISFFYEPFLWVFALIGIVQLRRRHAFTPFDRFMLGWLIFGVSAAIGYAGADAPHALWLTLPLAVFAAHALASCFIDYPDDLPAPFTNPHDTTPHPDFELLYSVRWGKWIMVGASVVLLTMLVMHIQFIGRSVLRIEGGSLTQILFSATDTTSTNVFRYSLLWAFMSAIFLVVGGFLAASVWGNRTTLQGIALGAAMVMVINGVSGGWSAGVFYADNPVEPWHTQTNTNETRLLRDRLLQLAARESVGYRELPITIVLTPSQGLTPDGIVAWLARDFNNVRLVNSVTEARRAEVIIMPFAADAEAPDLGGSYVGQNFTLSRDWQINSLQGFDFIAWWFQRQVRTQPSSALEVALWVRLDIYQSTPISETTRP